LKAIFRAIGVALRAIMKDRTNEIIFSNILVFITPL